MSGHLLNTIRPGIEAELRWRWQYADGEITAIASHAHYVETENEAGIVDSGALYMPIVQNRALIRTAKSGGITEDVGYRCGPIYVESPAPAFTPDRDIDWRQVEAAIRARRVDTKLRQLSEQDRLVLWLALGAKPRTELLQLGKRCNLLVLTSPMRFTRHSEERPIVARMDWLDRLARKAEKRRLKQDEQSILLAMQREAEAMLAEAGRAYGAAWA